MTAPTPESPFSVTFRMTDGYGCDVQVTMRDGVTKEIVKQVFEARKEFVELAVGHGWQFTAASKPAPQAAPASNGQPPAAQPQAAPPPGAVAGGGFASAASDVFDAETLVGSITEGKPTWKVKGGRFSQWGVTIYPEAIAAAGLGVEPGKTYSLAGWRAHYVMKPDGKPQKVTQLEKVG